MHIDRLGEKIGEGVQQSVYIHGDDEGKVVKVTNEQYPFAEGPNLVKARFYLTKIIHHLFPHNIPDVHLEASKENKSTIISERIFPIKEYEKLMQFKMTTTESLEQHKAYQLLLRAHTSRLEQHPLFSLLLSSLDRLDVSYDSSYINFAEDTKGNIVFVDKFDVLLINGKKSVEKMRTYIQEHGKIDNREKQLSYLDRYASIVNSDSELATPTFRVD